VTRRGWAALILVAWAVSLGWLVRRELGQTPTARLTEAALSVAPGAAFYRLDLGGQQVGLTSVTIDTVETGLAVTDVLALDVAALGALHRTRAISRSRVNRALRLQSVDAQFMSDLGRYAAHAVVSGDTLLTVTLGWGNALATTHVPLTSSIVLPSLLPLRLAFGGELKPGRAYAVSVFDPLLFTARSVRVRVAAESTLVVSDSASYDSTAMAWVPATLDTVRAFGIEQEAGGIRTRAWIDAQGRVVRSESPVAFTMERSVFEIAAVNFRHRDTVRLVRASAAPGPGEVIPITAVAARAPLRPDTAGTVAVRLRGVDLGGLALASARQRLAGDTLIVRRESASALEARYRLPARDAALRPFLTPEPLIQSDHPRLQAQARLIVGAERDPAQAARLLLAWVHRHLAHRAAGGIPSALQALTAAQGDCNEATALYVALARAVGLPARAAAGLLALGGRFYYHAWPEVYLSDWVAVDPLLDEFPADAAHLRFVVGALARQAELLPRIGRLTLEML
jgi:transglutaminase-like putative cysteine protease